MKKHPQTPRTNAPEQPANPDADTAGPHDPVEARPLPEGNARPDKGPGLEADTHPADLKQDTPGRPKSASSRQQTQPEQQTQTGDSDQDAANAAAENKT